MSNVTAANRYAVALFELAKEKSNLHEVNEKLAVVKQTFEENEDLFKVLNHPTISLEKKEQLIREGFSSLGDDIVHTLLLLLKKKRINEVIRIAERFRQLAEEEEKTAHAVVYTVKPLTDEEKEMISKTFAKKIGKNTLTIENKIDESLIGGLKLHVGDTIFDGSVKGKLARLERELVTGTR